MTGCGVNVYPGSYYESAIRLSTHISSDVWILDGTLLDNCVIYIYLRVMVFMIPFPLYCRGVGVFLMKRAKQIIYRKPPCDSLRARKVGIKIRHQSP